MITELVCSSVGMFGFAGLNVLLAVTETERAVNWFAAIVSAVAGTVCIGMIKHMSNRKVHIADNIDITKIVSTDMCAERVKNLERLQKMNKELLIMMIENAGMRVPPHVQE